MKKTIATALLALSMNAGTALAAVTVKGVTFQDTDVVANQTLQLNGAGVRVKVIFDVYAASLYLPQKQQSASAALSQGGAKSVHVVLLRDLTAAEFVEALVKGYKANNTEADQARLQPQLLALENMMLSTKNAPKGSRVRIELIPGAGTRIWFNDKRLGADIGGEDFYQCLMRIWLGNKPVDSDLKAALLGTS
jgi:hypothetical protein